MTPIDYNSVHSGGLWTHGSVFFPYIFIFSYSDSKNCMHSRVNSRILGALLYVTGYKLPSRLGGSGV